MARALLGDQVDDPGRAVRAVGGRGVGHHLDALEGVGRQLLQDLAAGRAGEQAGGLAVDQDGDVGVAAQADVALGAEGA